MYNSLGIVKVLTLFLNLYSFWGEDLKSVLFVLIWIFLHFFEKSKLWIFLKNLFSNKKFSKFVSIL